MIAYLCPKCAARQAILPPKIEAASIVRCAQCSRKHGRLDEVQRQLADQAREVNARKVREVYKARPTGKNRSSPR
jgi:DNA-directed RNA polymerase subunit RPC12/RpoP